MLLLGSFSPFYVQHSNPLNGTINTQCGPSHLKPSQAAPHRQSQMCGSQMILDPVNLTTLTIEHVQIHLKVNRWSQREVDGHIKDSYYEFTPFFSYFLDPSKEPVLFQYQQFLYHFPWFIWLHLNGFSLQIIFLQEYHDLVQGAVCKRSALASPETQYKMRCLGST